MRKNKKIITEHIFKSLYEDKVFIDVLSILKFLKTKNNNNSDKVLKLHSNEFLIFIFRLATMYEFRYIKKEIKLINTSLFFKFSDYVLFNDKKWPVTETEKLAIIKIIKSLIKAGIIKKKILDIENDRKAVFYSIDFSRIALYFKYLYNNIKLIKKENELIFKQKLIDGSIT